MWREWARHKTPALQKTAPEGAMLVSGAGAPQNREEGARKLIALAATGNLGAVRAIGDSLGQAAHPGTAGKP